MEKGHKKIAGGIGLVIAGILGVIFGKDLKSRLWRVIALSISVCSIGGGFYFIIDGLDELAVAQIGHNKLGQVGFSYENSLEFYKGLTKTFNKNKELRRLSFKCNDGSKSFTVYSLEGRPVNVPNYNITCDDGIRLLQYSK